MFNRRSKFGFQPPAQPNSTYTVRSIPLTQGVKMDQPWPLLPPGSAQSMTNFLPLDGVLVPRSRLSNTTSGSALLAARGMAEVVTNVPGVARVWYSSQRSHALIASNGSISQASFTSAFGLGSIPVDENIGWHYAPAFSDVLDANVLVAAGYGGSSSADTLLVLYQPSGVNSAPRYSYLTSAPRAFAVCAFDNYLIAWNVTEDGVVANTRAKWCQRGNYSNWTGEGSGFEDLLAMQGEGTAIHPMPDNRVVLFSNREIWYGVGAAYPAQFQFYPLDPDVGCYAQKTIQRCEDGLLFLGSDQALRLLPNGGGKSRVVVPQVFKRLRRAMFYESILGTLTWGLYDPLTKLYYLFIQTAAVQIASGIVVNVVTGESGFLSFDGNNGPTCGVALGSVGRNAFANEGLLFANRVGEVSSANSVKATEGSSSVVTSTWRSGPVAPEIPNFKLITEAFVNYQATSRSTLKLKYSTDGGNNYESSGRTLSLTSAPISGRVKDESYLGGESVTLEIASASTGYELHGVDVGVQIGGRR